MSLPKSEKMGSTEFFCFAYVSHDRKMVGAPGKLPWQQLASCESVPYRSVLH